MLLPDWEALGLDDLLESLGDRFGQILTVGSRNFLPHLLDGYLNLWNYRRVLLTKACRHDYGGNIR